MNKKKQKKILSKDVFWSHDLEVMGLARFRCATLLVDLLMCFFISQPAFSFSKRKLMVPRFFSQIFTPNAMYTLFYWKMIIFILKYNANNDCWIEEVEFQFENNVMKRKKKRILKLKKLRRVFRFIYIPMFFQIIFKIFNFKNVLLNFIYYLSKKLIWMCWKSETKNFWKFLFFHKNNYLTFGF